MSFHYLQTRVGPVLAANLGARAPFVQHDVGGEIEAAVIGYKRGADAIGGNGEAFGLEGANLVDARTRLRR